MQLWAPTLVSSPNPSYLSRTFPSNTTKVLLGRLCPTWEILATDIQSMTYYIVEKLVRKPDPQVTYCMTLFTILPRTDKSTDRRFEADSRVTARCVVLEGNEDIL